jgi:hypothetical protein
MKDRDIIKLASMGASAAISGMKEMFQGIMNAISSQKLVAKVKARELAIMLEREQNHEAARSIG